jgi:hypothetical protein
LSAAGDHLPAALSVRHSLRRVLLDVLPVLLAPWSPDEPLELNPLVPAPRVLEPDETELPDEPLPDEPVNDDPGIPD